MDWISKMARAFYLILQLYTFFEGNHDRASVIVFNLTVGGLRNSNVFVQAMLWNQKPTLLHRF